MAVHIWDKIIRRYLIQPEPAIPELSTYAAMSNLRREHQKRATGEELARIKKFVEYEDRMRELQGDNANKKNPKGLKIDLKQRTGRRDGRLANFHEFECEEGGKEWVWKKDYDTVMQIGFNYRTASATSKYLVHLVLNGPNQFIIFNEGEFGGLETGKLPKITKTTI